MPQISLKDTLPSNVFYTVTASIAVVFAPLSLVSTFLFFSFSVASFALLFLYETRRTPWFSILSPFLVAAIGAVLSPIHLPILLAAPLSGACIAHFYRTSRPKFDAALCAVGILLLAEVISLWLSAGVSVGAWYPSDAVAYYQTHLASLADTVLSSVKEALLSSSSAEAVTTDVIFYMEELVGVFFSLIIAWYAILAFLTVGISFKVLKAVALRVDADGGMRMRRFNFSAPVVFAYAYIVLFFLTLFTAGARGAFAVVVENLYLIFMVIFAYIGYKYLRFMISRSPRVRRFRVLIVAVALLAFSLTVQLLSVEGVLAVLTANRLQKHRGGSSQE